MPISRLGFDTRTEEEVFDQLGPFDDSDIYGDDAYSIGQRDELPRADREASSGEVARPGSRYEGLQTGRTRTNDWPQIPDPFPLISRAKLRDQPKRRWLWEDFLPESSIGMLYGKSGAKKSFLAIGLACAIATGVRFLDREAVHGSVIYAAVDDGFDDVDQRISAWEARYGCQVGNLHLVAVPVRLGDPSFADVFSTSIRRVPRLKLVVFDTLARVSPRLDESSAKDIGIIIDTLSEIRDATGAAQLVVHHSLKSDAREYRGSSALYAGMETVIQVSALGTTEVSLTVTKQKSAPGGTKVFALAEASGESLALVTSGAHDPRVQTSSANDTSRRAVLAALASLGDDGGTHAEWTEACVRHGCSKSIFNRQLPELRRANIVCSVGGGVNGRGALYQLVDPDSSSRPGAGSGEPFAEAIPT